MNTEEVVDQAIGMSLLYGPKLIGAILVWIIGGWVINVIDRVVKSGLDKSGTDPSLKPFLTGIVNGLLKVMLVITVLGMLGIEMTSFIAIIGALLKPKAMLVVFHRYKFSIPL